LSTKKLTTEPPISSASVTFCSNFAFLLVPVRHIELLSVQGQKCRPVQEKKNVDLPLSEKWCFQGNKKTLHISNTPWILLMHNNVGAKKNYQGA